MHLTVFGWKTFWCLVCPEQATSRLPVVLCSVRCEEFMMFVWKRHGVHLCSNELERQATAVK